MTYDFKKALMNLKKEKNACILAHNYQAPEIQDVADFVGDSFELALKSKTIQEDTVLFCGVHFMAESCKLLAPEKKVIIPSMAAGCSLADSISPEEIVEFKKRIPLFRLSPISIPPLK